jgi:hypothetical protein
LGFDVHSGFQTFPLIRRYDRLPCFVLEYRIRLVVLTIRRALLAGASSRQSGGRAVKIAATSSNSGEL